MTRMPDSYHKRRCAELEKVVDDLSRFSAEQLIEELASREGVRQLDVAATMWYQIDTQHELLDEHGPTTILVIKD